MVFLILLLGVSAFSDSFSIVIEEKIELSESSESEGDCEEDKDEKKEEKFPKNRVSWSELSLIKSGSFLRSHGALECVYLGINVPPPEHHCFF